MQYRKKVSINKELMSIFYPSYYISTIFCLRKYNINHNYVEKITRKNIACGISAVCAMSGFYFSVMKYTQFSVTYYQSVYNIIYFEYLFNFIGLCFINLYNSSTSVRVLFFLHEVNKTINNSDDLKKIKILSYCSASALLLAAVILVVFKIVYDSTWTLMRGLYVSTTILLDLEIVQVMVITYTLTCQTCRWNRNIQNIKFGNDNDDVTIDRENVVEEIQDAVVFINEAWSLTIKNSGLIISLHFITTFIQTLVYVGVLIIWSKMRFENVEVINSHTFGVVLWLTKVFLVELGLCLACESLYKELGNAQSNVLVKLSQDVPSKKTWKNIYRVLHKDFELSACGLFCVTAATMLNFCNLVATYTIVLLQFAFL